MIPPADPPIDVASFTWDFLKKDIQQSRIEELSKLHMEPIQSSRGWYGYELPFSRWREHNKPTIRVSNYESWPAEAPGWILKVKSGGDYVAMLRKKALTDMTEEEWKALLGVIKGVLDDYPLLDDSYHSELEQEYQDKAWKAGYREDFQKAMAAKFEEVLTTLYRGDELQAKFDAMIADEGATDKFFHTYMSFHGSGGEWMENDDGSMCLDIDDIVDGIDTPDIVDYLQPEDPRQMKFKFMRQAEALLAKMLDDDLMCMVESPIAQEIVDTLFEDAGLV